jgi:hypothetical protein
MVQPASEGRLPEVDKAESSITPSGVLEASPPLTLAVTVTAPPGFGVVVDADIVITELL